MSRRTDEALLWLGLTVAIAVVLGSILAFVV